MLERLDNFLRSNAQKFCDNAQKYTGLTKFVFLKWNMVLSSLFIMASAICDRSMFLVSVALLNSVAVIRCVHDLEQEESEFLANGKIKLSFLHSVYFRTRFILIVGVITILLLIIADPPSYLLVCANVCMIAWVYLAVCTPRPPGKSKMREWCEKGLWRLNDWLKPEPALVSTPASDR